MLLYKNIEILSRRKHQNLKLQAIENYAFAAGVHWMPIAGVEFFQSAVSYPIIFVTEASSGRETITPIVLLGLRAGKNDYITLDNSWRANNYIPAYVRRYPFIFSSASGNEERLAVCLDADCEYLNERTGEALFNDDGTGSQFLQQSINFMNQLNAELKRTHEFVDLLLKHDLLVSRVIDIQGTNGQMLQLPGFSLIDQERFSKLTERDLGEFASQGFLGWVFAHQISLHNLPTLLDRHLLNEVVATMPDDRMSAMNERS